MDSIYLKRWKSASPWECFVVLKYKWGIASTSSKLSCRSYIRPGMFPLRGFEARILGSIVHVWGLFGMSFLVRTEV